MRRTRRLRAVVGGTLLGLVPGLLLVGWGIYSMNSGADCGWEGMSEGDRCRVGGVIRDYDDQQKDSFLAGMLWISVGGIVLLAGGYLGAKLSQERLQDEARGAAKFTSRQRQPAGPAPRAVPASETAPAAPRPPARHVDALLRAADAALEHGDADQALALALDAVRNHSGEDRERARQRLLHYFQVLGPQDPRVAETQKRLASLLF
ncbi:tetratricopeptide repeat protein [Kitasatospora sp. NPDC056138]|uniref:tetratricopeptide repeat protein n=1 Tax=Kitasatospora sp. NPDC056138 TaxID=3345724 RepID=UPI0035D57EDF